MPLPVSDFDPTEAAVPWKYLTESGYRIVFATPSGTPGACDERMLTGQGLGLLAGLLSADANGRGAYREMERSVEFRSPIPWSEIQVQDFDGLILAGGHAPGMKAYLESALLQGKVAEFFKAAKPVGAICHGVVLAARSQLLGVSVLHNKRTTALLATQEMSAWMLTFSWLGSYYRTYPQAVEAEVRAALENSNQFSKGPTPILRDNQKQLSRGFVVRDGNYVSARWPGDAHRFAHEFKILLQAQGVNPSTPSRL